ncbi:uncharacterized protein MYCGRDRAFT_91867 [Zymoseptoria tritici IPO323]|uniref:Nucleotide-diphospho-sugar transferase domain-containing protein n=1 Tax=Zymoseptoria tritici (strain CBS 115943 / IPO323) TaxID=336722 RepID=F9X706_ZYMTI|nr:uncharacterized protein MYCGRDRAFT_91867 [Zymoseptoria tritici IPO323]EGP89315.1 hypothetical protein MYCGRDRAFT_91867 [Zymoseptoria tritici IPO323]
MDHYLYAQIHGYDYKYVHAQQMDGYHVTWILPHILASLLPDYDFVLALDSDVTATQMEVPLEWLFNRWNITSQTSIAMPWDTLEERPDTHQILSQDSKGNQVLNTGFVLVQNLPFTFDMLQAWSECPTEKRYKGCGHWKKNWSHEQRAFSEFIRYDFNPQGDNIVPIACDDAMSWPGAVDERPGPYRLLNDCQGRFFRHHTWHKERPREEFQDSAMQLLTRLLQERVKQNVDTILIEESKGQLGRR